jgi:elongation factor G
MVLRGWRPKRKVFGNSWTGELSEYNIDNLSSSETEHLIMPSSRHNVPTRLMFINKLDRPGASVRDSILSLLSHRLHPTPILIALPIASLNPETYSRGEPGIEGVVDLAKWEVWKWESGTKDATRHPLPTSQNELQNQNVFPPEHPLLDHLVAARTEFIDSIALLSPDLLSEIVEEDSYTGDAYLRVPSSVILSSLRELTLQKKVLPVFCGSALNHIGTELLMDYVGELLASPTDVDRLGPPSAAIQKKPGLVQLLAWKVGWDKRKGWMTFVRIYAGS